MRVIAGKFKGRRLKTASGQQTRPTSDKIKEAVFHRMGPFFDGGEGLDLFAGSGSLGIEGLSRGLDNFIFVDQSPQAVKTIRQNIELLGIEDKAAVYRQDVWKALDTITKKDLQFSLILLDPPYDKGIYQKVIDKIISADLLKQDALLYIEHRPEVMFVLPENIEPIFNKQYNETTNVMIFEKR